MGWEEKGGKQKRRDETREYDIRGQETICEYKARGARQLEDPSGEK